MSATYAMLGLLEGQPSYGYELKKAYDHLLAMGKPLAFGQVYATLARLRRDGLVSEVPDTDSSGGPERTKYAITAAGTATLHEWLAQAEPSAPHLQATMYLKVVLALHGQGEPNRYLDAQRRAHLARMRELTHQRIGASIDQVLILDHAIFHLEADLRWIELTSSRLTQLKGELHR